MSAGSRRTSGAGAAAEGWERRVKRIALVLPALLLLNVSCGQGQSSIGYQPERTDWRFGRIGGQKFITQHYHIYTTADNRVLLAHLPGFMEAAHTQYLKLTGLPDEARKERMSLYVMGSREQWAMLTQEVTGPHSELFLAIENGGYCYEGTCVLWDMGHFATFSVAAHEGLHQFLHYRVRNGLPSWVEEGLATQMEGFDVYGNEAVRFNPDHNVLRPNDLRNAIASERWLGVPALLTTDPGEQIHGAPLTAPQYYGQVWALIMYIRSQPKYLQGFQRMIADARLGKLPGPPMEAEARTGGEYRRAIAVPVFRKYISDDLSGFEREFRKYASKLARIRD